MRSIPVDVQAALDAQSLVLRDFMWITARNRETGAPVSEGFWSGVRPVRAQIMDPSTGQAVEREFFGAGALIAIDPIPLVSNLTVQRVKVQFSQIDGRVDELVRRYDVKQARIEIYRGVFNPETMVMVAPAEPRFFGHVDGAPLGTPPEGGAGGVVLECVSDAQEFTRSNPDVRSHASQRQRAPGDDFFKTVTREAHKEIFWGTKRKKRRV